MRGDKKNINNIRESDGYLSFDLQVTTKIATFYF